MRCLYYCIRLLACYVSRERALPGSVFQKLRVKVGRILQTEPLVSIYYSLIVRSMLLLDGLGFPSLSCYSSIGYLLNSNNHLGSETNRSQQGCPSGTRSFYVLSTKLLSKSRQHCSQRQKSRYTYCRIHCDVIENSTRFFFYNLRNLKTL